MKLKTSFCNPTLLKKNIGRFAVIWGLFTFFLFLVFSQQLLNMRSYYSNGEEMSRLNFIRNLLMEDGAFIGLFTTQVYAIICAAACFNYLHKTRSAYMLHAFPLTRDGLFSTNLISGLLFGLVPMVFISLLNILITASVAGAAAVVLNALAIWVLEYLFFYGLAVLCMVLTGQTIFGMLCYGVLNYVFILLELALRILAEPLLFGISNFDVPDLLTKPLSPTVNLVFLAEEDLYLRDTWSSAFWGYLGIIAGVGVVLMLAAWLLYRLRHMENAGEVIAYAKLRPIFKYFFTVCISLGLGLILVALIDPDSLSDGNGFGLLLCLLFAGLIGYFAAEMMLKRTLRVFNKKAFAGFGIFAAVLVALFCIVQFDVFGVIHRVPEVDSVKYVELSSDSWLYSENDPTVRFEDPKDIETVTGLHRSIINYHDKDYYGEPVSFTLTYHLKNGLTLRRTYCCGYGPEGADQKLKQLMDRPDIIRSYYDLDALRAAGGADVIYTPYWSDNGYLNAQQMQELAACLEEDIGNDRVRFYEYLFYGQGGSFGIQLPDKTVLEIPECATAAYAFLKDAVPEIVEDEPVDVISYD